MRYILKSNNIRKNELHSSSDFIPYERFKSKCWPEMTFLRGDTVYKKAKIVSTVLGKFIEKLPDEKGG